MNSKGKYIGLNQRIPFDVLDSAIHFYLENGVVDKTYIFQRMQEFTSGTNRANKATSYVVQIMSRQAKLLDQLKKEKSNTLYSSLRLDDRKALCLCLISLTYPITYDLLIALSQGFKVQNQINKLFAVKGKQSVDSFHKRLGKIMWEKCGMARNAEGLKQAIEEIRKIKAEFWKDVRVLGSANELNMELEKAGRVADFIELGELMCMDALNRNESCGGHFREEYQTEEGEAKRDDDNFKYVAAWEYKGDSQFELHKEELNYEVIKVTQRSYK